MTFSHSSSHTSSYTVADIEKVVLNVKTDLLMIADSTKAISREEAGKYGQDIELAAKNGYLNFVDITLMNALGGEIKAAKYHFKTGGEVTDSSRPGGVRWPETPLGSVRVIFNTTEIWNAEPAKVAQLPWNFPWRSVSVDTNHNGLTPSGTRGYSSNSFGADRNDFS